MYTIEQQTSDGEWFVIREMHANKYGIHEALQTFQGFVVNRAGNFRFTVQL